MFRPSWFLLLFSISDFLRPLYFVRYSFPVALHLDDHGNGWDERKQGKRGKGLAPSSPSRGDSRQNKTKSRRHHTTLQRGEDPGATTRSIIRWIGVENFVSCPPPPYHLASCKPALHLNTTLSHPWDHFGLCELSDFSSVCSVSRHFLGPLLGVVLRGLWWSLGGPWCAFPGCTP